MGRTNIATKVVGEVVGITSDLPVLKYHYTGKITTSGYLNNVTIPVTLTQEEIDNSVVVTRAVSVNGGVDEQHYELRTSGGVVGVQTIRLYSDDAITKDIYWELFVYTNCTTQAKGGGVSTGANVGQYTAAITLDTPIDKSKSLLFMNLRPDDSQTEPRDLYVAYEINDAGTQVLLHMYNTKVSNTWYYTATVVTSL